MKNPYELWTSYARRRFTEAGLIFNDWDPVPPAAGSDRIFVSEAESANMKSSDISVLLRRTYTPEAFSRMMDSSREQNPFKVFKGMGIAEQMRFRCEDGDIALYVLPPNRIEVIDATNNLPKSLSPARNRTFEPVLERLVRYVDRRLKE
jgi:hypothetical protein